MFHTYSQYARGLESTGGSYYFLDLTALGRQEAWEKPEGRSPAVRAASPDFASKDPTSRIVPTPRLWTETPCSVR